MNYEYHEIANIFPMLLEPELIELANDIERNGQHEPIVLYDGKILDGRNRYQACKRAGVVPTTKAYTGDDPIGFVVSLNLRRRHLNESQRGMVAANIARLTPGANQHTQKQVPPIGGTTAPTTKHTAEMLNVGTRTVERARKVQDHAIPELAAEVVKGNVAVSTAAIVAELPQEKQAEIVARGEKEILKAANEIRATKAKEIRAKRIEKIAGIAQGNAELRTDKKYAVIYADPPWKYDVVISASREIENHYPTMTDDEISDLPVGDLANEDAIIYLWVVSGKIPFGCELLNRWGFEYKSSFVWVKDRIGLGFHSRVQHELLLVGTRGKIPAPSPDKRVSSVIQAPIQEHSKKPEIVRDWIGDWYSGLPMIELFARQSGNGWDTWGNQSGQCA
jgi:N6-adenosine-specific RNA methylase IME4